MSAAAATAPLKRGQTARARSEGGRRVTDASVYKEQGFCSFVDASDSSGSPAPGSAVPSAMKSH
jgi:hypothetical protein